jgi:hypothetical protein
VRAGDQDLGGLGDRLRGRRSHRAAAQRDLRILAPELRRAQRGEGAPHLAPCPHVVGLGLVARGAVAAPALVRPTTSGVACANPGGHGDRCYARRGPEDRLGTLVRAALELSDRNESQLAATDEPQLGLDVALERIQRHAERHRGLLAAQRNARDIAGRSAHGVVDDNRHDSLSSAVSVNSFLEDEWTSSTGTMSG